MGKPLSITRRDAAGSLLVTGRTEAWHGAAVDVSTLLARGQVHTASAWVRLAGAVDSADGTDSTAEVRLTLERDPGSDDRGSRNAGSGCDANADRQSRLQPGRPGADGDPVGPVT